MHNFFKILFCKGNGFQIIFSLCMSVEGERERDKEVERKLFSHLVSHGYVNLYFGTDGRSEMDRVRKRKETGWNNRTLPLLS